MENRIPFSSFFRPYIGQSQIVLNAGITTDSEMGKKLQTRWTGSKLLQNYPELQLDSEHEFLRIYAPPSYLGSEDDIINQIYDIIHF